MHTSNRFRHLILLLFLPLLSACAAMPLDVHDESFNHVMTVHVASMRGTDADGEHGSDRLVEPKYFLAEVEVPHRHFPGRIVEAGTVGAAPDMAFTARAEQSVESLSAFTRTILQNAPSGRRVVLFVHGFNTEYDSSLYRLAQLAHDFELPAAPVLFSWPSDHNVLSYIHDRDSSDYSRGALADLIESLVNRGARVQLVGHSMGAATIVETLAEMNLRRSSAVAQLDGVTLISPDIDLELFIQRASELRRLPRPFIIYSTPDQLPFNLMTAFLTNGKPRLGGRIDPEALAGLPITYVDTSNISHGSVLDVHIALATSPEMIDAISSMRVPDLARYPALARDLPGVELEQLGRMTWMKLPSDLNPDD